MLRCAGLLSTLALSTGLTNVRMGLQEPTGSARSRAPRAVATLDKAEVVQVTRTEETVQQLNSVHLERHRCHSVATDAPPTVDPFKLVQKQLEPLSAVVRAQLDAESQTLGQAAQHFFGAGSARQGKRVRPVIVLLVGQATQKSSELDEDLLRRRVELASITEMIHTASLIHDDVLDAADTRRGDFAVHKRFNNKAAVLSGDFLLARASVALAKLGDPQVVREMAKSLEALVQGELMQLRSSEDERLSMEYYLTKSYCKTASLMAYSCKSSALLSGHALTSDVTVAAEKFGYHFGIAFQVIDDLLDFTGTSDTLGKPGLQDMSLGLSTAPVLYAADEFPELKALIARKFGQEGDVQHACEIVLGSQGLRRTEELATHHAQAAVDACCSLPDSPSRQGLVNLCHKVLSRSS
mmetsp:Transcript_51619/g.112335  ORF Transcript_51619/g.112335 Transcript_51619/m.112335 type:complete len:410 (+) Transcript_51619:137-1366(+)